MVYGAESAGNSYDVQAAKNAEIARVTKETHGDLKNLGEGIHNFLEEIK